MAWADVRGEMGWDGSWRDIYVFDTDARAWAALLGSLPGWNYRVLYEQDGRDAPWPNTFPEATPDGVTGLLTVDLGGIQANCHCFCEEIIEFDIDPREVQTEEAFDRVHRFMRQIGDLLGREVVLTHENIPEAVIAAYRPVGSSAGVERPYARAPAAARTPTG